MVESVLSEFIFSFISSNSRAKEETEISEKHHIIGIVKIGPTGNDGGDEFRDFRHLS